MVKQRISDEQKRCVQLVRLARRKGWTLEEMAHLLGTSFSTVSRWHNGKNIPYRRTAERMIPTLEELLA